MDGDNSTPEFENIEQFAPDSLVKDAFSKIFNYGYRFTLSKVFKILVLEYLVKKKKIENTGP